jgi:GNAT acetyltransferase-like protein
MGWRLNPVGLNYRLGESLLFTVRRPGFVYTAHFSDLSLDDPPALPVEATAREAVDVCIIRSQPVSNALPRLSRTDGWIRYVPHQYNRYFVELAGTFENYLKHFSGKSRYTIKRHVRRFCEVSNGKIDFRQYATPEELDKFRPLAIELSARTYQTTVLGSGLPATDDFWRRAREAAKREEIRAYLLFLAERPVAFIYCAVERGIIEQRYIGFDPDYRDHAPGVVLLYCTLESLFGAGVDRMYDFTEGENLQKQQFGTKHVYCADIYFFRNSLANAALVGLHCVISLFSDWLGRRLQVLGIKESAKHLVRILHGSPRSTSSGRI